VRDAWRAWDFQAALGATALFAGATRFMPVSERAHIAKEMISVAAPIAIAVIAILVAGFVLFSTLADKGFKKAMGSGMLMTSGAFLFAISFSAAAVAFDVLLFGLTYIPPFVASAAFWLFGMMAFFGFVYTITMAMQSAYELTIVTLGRR
jgi:hypothetical protein